MQSGLRRAADGRKTRFADLSWNSAWQIRQSDGRRWMYFYDDAGQHRSIYRYQWVWIVANGPIPPGFHIHHRNHDCTDDRLENLAMMPGPEHFRIHPIDFNKARTMVESRGVKFIGGAPEWTCETCGSKFKRYARAGSHVRRFCSPACRYTAMRGQRPFCARGHEMTPENTQIEYNGNRRCRACRQRRRKT